MKNIIIVSKGTNAVGVSKEGAPVQKTAQGTFLANLEVIKEVLATIPVEPCETTNIWVGDLLRGLTTNSAIEYVKTGKTGSGADLSAEEIAGFAEVYKMYAERLLNVRFSLFKYIKREDAEMQALKTTAWNTLNSYAVTAVQTQVVSKQEVVDPDKIVRDMMDKKMIEALDNGNFEEYAKIKALRDELKEPQVVTVESTVAGTAPQTVTKPQTFASVIDTAFAKSGETGDAIGFKLAENNENQQPISWDGEAQA